MSVSFLKRGDIPDLGWLASDDFRTEVVPKQNLDVIPDLQALWSHKDRSSLAFVPNSDDAPKTMGDLGPRGVLRLKGEDISRRTKLALMRGCAPPSIRRAIVEQCGIDDSDPRWADVESTLQKDAGLVGRLYVYASDFPRCHSSSDERKFVLRHAGSAEFVVKKAACEDCVHRLKLGGGSVCGVFQKQIVVNVPFSNSLADKIESQELLKGKVIRSNPGASPQERIRLAYAASMPAPTPTAVVQHKPGSSVRAFAPPKPITARPQVRRGRAMGALRLAAAAGRLRVEEFNDYRQRVQSATEQSELESLTSTLAGLVQGPTPREVYAGSGVGVGVHELISPDSLVRSKRKTAASDPVFQFIRDHLLLGWSAKRVKLAATQKFSPETLRASFPFWGPLYKQAGVFGAVYSTQEAFSNCRDGAAALRNSRVSYIVKSSVCDGCVHRSESTCSVYRRPLVASASWEVADQLLADYQYHRLLPKKSASADFGKNPISAMRSMVARASQQGRLLIERKTAESTTKYRAPEPRVYKTSAGTKLQIVVRARELMNEGLFGRRLARTLQQQFIAMDLAAASEELKKVTSEQGLQGVFYIDPSVYADYGRGCAELRRKFKESSVKYLKRSNKCKNCIHRVGNLCSQLDKPLVGEPPYENKAEAQRLVLASERRQPKKSITKNPVEEFQIKSSLHVSLAETPESTPTPELTYGGLYL